MRLLALLVLAGVVLGYLGELHPAGDSAAVLWPLGAALGAVLVVAGGLARSAAVAWPAAAALVLAGAGLLPSLWPEAAIDAAGIEVASFNVLWSRAASEPLIADLRAAPPTIVALQEVGPALREALGALADIYPVQIYCGIDPHRGVALLVAGPAVSTGCSDFDRTAWAVLARPEGALTAVSLHLRWPYPYAQAPQAARIAALVAGLPAPRVVMGDFNAPPWGRTVRGIAAAAGARVPGGWRLSYRGLLPIDHILPPAHWDLRIRVGAPLGSDHAPIRATLIRRD